MWNLCSSLHNVAFVLWFYQPIRHRHQKRVKDLAKIHHRVEVRVKCRNNNRHHKQHHQVPNKLRKIYLYYFSFNINEITSQPKSSHIFSSAINLINQNRKNNNKFTFETEIHFEISIEIENRFFQININSKRNLQQQQQYCIRSSLNWYLF